MSAQCSGGPYVILSSKLTTASPSRIYNVITDDPATELVIEYLALWPGGVSALSSHNARLVLDAAADVLERSLRLYPYNTSWYVCSYHSDRASDGVPGAVAGRRVSTLPV